ncbi:MAG: penicillin-binding protein 2 [Phycisphaeraceae bacterium]|nr:penicillin-binding protein 2 [Phycisphaeraceae bacterium]
MIAPPATNTSRWRPTRSRADCCAAATVFGIAAFLVVMLGRVAQLQLRPSEDLRQHLNDRVSVVREPGVRGEILDRRGRLAAGTRFGYRIFVDPTRFPVPPDEALIKLADASGLPMSYLASRLVPTIAENERRAAMAAGEVTRVDPETNAVYSPKPLPLSRYRTIGDVLEDWRVDSVRAAKIPGVYLELRGVRETPGSALAASIIGKVGVDHAGLAGAELMLDNAVSPTPGRLSYVRDAFSHPLWIEQGAYVPPTRGRDVRLSIDLELQRMAIEELERGLVDADAAGGRLVMLDPLTGEIVAMVDLVRDLPDAVPFDWNNPLATGRRYITIRPDPNGRAHPELARNRCIEDVYEPGSTFKPFMWAVTTELGLADPGEVIDTGGGNWYTAYGRHVADVVKKDRQTWAEVLINSSNIGMAKVTRRMSDEQMRGAVVRFGFGSRVFPDKPEPGQFRGLPGESPGIVTSLKSWSKYTQTSVAMGHEVAVTPIQMVRAYSAFARTGDAAGTIPPVRLVARDIDGPTDRVVRVLPSTIANLTRETMRGVAHNLDLRLARSKEEPLPKYDLFAKSGTAEIPIGPAPKGIKKPRGFKGYYPNQYNASFIAAGPSESPRLVCIVVIDDPGPDRVRRRLHYGSQTAGPVVRRVMERSLAYLGVPPSFASEADAVAQGHTPAEVRTASAGSQR